MGIISVICLVAAFGLVGWKIYDAKNKITGNSVMRRMLLAGVVGVFLGAWMTGASAAECGPLPQSLQAMSYRIVVNDGEGSGFAIGNGKVVTAAHVTDSLPMVGVSLRSGVVTALVAASDYDNDVAVLSTRRNVPTPPVASYPLEPGDPVASAGYPMGGPLVVKYGEVGYMEDNYIITTLDVDHGDSGAPVWVCRGGRWSVAGVVTAYGALGKTRIANFGVVANMPVWVYAMTTHRRPQQ